MNVDADLPTLIKRKDHLNVLRYIRVHALRKPALVVEHGKKLLGPDLSFRSDDLSRRAALEQICGSALDLGDTTTAEACLSQLRKAGVEKTSVRFRFLLARCLEADGDYEDAEKIYDELLSDNAAHSGALRRKYCILKAQVGKEVAAMEALNRYLEQNCSDPTGWYEMASMRMALGDFKGASFALEEVLLCTPLEPKIHCELAECYATIGGLENLGLARKHMAQALELDGSCRRAQFGLLMVSKAFLAEAAKASKKDYDEYDNSVAKELAKYAGEQVIQAYQGTSLLPSVKKIVEDAAKSS